MAIVVAHDDEVERSRSNLVKEVKRKPFQIHASQSRRASKEWEARGTFGSRVNRSEKLLEETVSDCVARVFLVVGDDVVDIALH